MGLTVRHEKNHVNEIRGFVVLPVFLMLAPQYIETYYKPSQIEVTKYEDSRSPSKNID